MRPRLISLDEDLSFLMSVTLSWKSKSLKVKILNQGIALLINNECNEFLKNKVLIRSMKLVATNETFVIIVRADDQLFNGQHIFDKC